MKLRQPPSLTGLVSRRIVAFTVLAMVLQFGIVLAEYWSDDSELGRFIIEHETDALSEGITVRNGKLTFALSHEMRERYTNRGDDGDGALYLRVRTANGAILFSSCEAICQAHFLPVEINPPAFWQRQIAPGKPLSVAGGRSFTVGSQEVFVELAVVKDPHSFIYNVLFHELRDHLIIPMLLMFGLVAGATILSIRAALKPVIEAAEAADNIDPRNALDHLPTRGMPREIANFANAVNRVLVRVADLIQAQKIFSTAIAHEIRTPVAIVRMELERIDGERARKAERDLDALTHMLEQLTSLAKLDVVDSASFRMVSLSDLANDSVAALAPFVFANGHSLEFDDAGTSPVYAVPSLIENTIRNLVENAVRHTPKGTHIVVRTGPGRRLDVIDDGPGFGSAAARVLEGGRIKSSDKLGVGLKIVERIAALHGAVLTLDSDDGKGTRVRLDFPAPAEPSAA
ncbi:HAMP domain-containing sensor histidine kinase [Rhizobium sp. 32-5/1]|uniref:sensor histidine kinase n=1 Tax=Rhizobium sp. 32-5/1 TaxID=3019602 RepID=UPI00240DD172|nr:HAMP domain-containing sensor histidine kinase [Rhizobium sp. 32-5/1]WEZ84334.1 HAMP domain-containing sensor histidine kinase [Rhizobium sp. 32-5/1]